MLVDPGVYGFWYVDAPFVQNSMRQIDRPFFCCCFGETHKLNCRWKESQSISEMSFSDYESHRDISDISDFFRSRRCTELEHTPFIVGQGGLPLPGVRYRGVARNFLGLGRSSHPRLLYH